MRKILFLADLDHNLFQSKRVNSQGTKPMTVNKDGEAHCFATQAQQTLLDLMTSNAYCIPVTARTPAQMMRVTGWHVSHDYQLALCDLGMTLLYRHGSGPWEPIEAWSSELLETAADKARSLENDFSQFQVDLVVDLCPSTPKRLKFVMNTCFENADVPFYFLAQQANKSEEGRINPELIRKVCGRFMDQRPGRYFYHESDGTHALWPTYIGKGQAVSRLMTLLENGMDDPRFEAFRAEMGSIDLVLASGDSLSDLPFMQAADYWMAPSKSQISSLVAPPLDAPFTVENFSQ